MTYKMCHLCYVNRIDIARKKSLDYEFMMHDHGYQAQ